MTMNRPTHLNPDERTVALEALREAHEQVSYLQARLGIVDRGGGTLTIVSKAIAALEATRPELVDA